jgi:hypothetical protein
MLNAFTPTRAAKRGDCVSVKWMTFADSMIPIYHRPMNSTIHSLREEVQKLKAELARVMSGSPDAGVAQSLFIGRNKTLTPRATPLGGSPPMNLCPADSLTPGLCEDTGVEAGNALTPLRSSFDIQYLSDDLLDAEYVDDVSPSEQWAAPHGESCPGINDGALSDPSCALISDCDREITQAVYWHSIHHSYRLSHIPGQEQSTEAFLAYARRDCTVMAAFKAFAAAKEATLRGTTESSTYYKRKSAALTLVGNDVASKPHLHMNMHN